MNNDEIINKQEWSKNGEVIKDGKAVLIIRINLNDMLNEARADQKRKDIEKLEKAMPYPEDVFIPRSKAEIKLVVELIKKNNLSPDGIFGEYMRRSWQNAIAKLKED